MKKLHTATKAQLKAEIKLLLRRVQIAEEAAKEHELAHMDMAKVAPAQVRVDVAVLTDRDHELFATCAQLLAECKERTEHVEKLLTRLHDELTAKLAAMVRPPPTHLLTSEQAPYSAQRKAYAGAGLPQGQKTRR